MNHVARTGPVEDFYAIVPAGGVGSRLWPLSRAASPKFLHDLTGTGRSLLQSTWDRLEPLAGAGGIALVTGKSHVEAAASQLPRIDERMLMAEPLQRESMAAIGLAAAVLHERHGDVIVGSFAADQIVSGRVAFERAVHEAIAAARQDYVVTIGIAASRPSTAFGYVRCGEELGVDGAPSALHALGFTEKPDAATAREYLDTGEYRWNAGIFVVRTSILLDHLATLHPELHSGLRRIARSWDTPHRESIMAEVWPTLESIAIDNAVAEPIAAEGGVAVVPGTFGWDDVGDFNSLAGVLTGIADSGDKIVGPEENVVRLETAGNVIVPGTDRVIALLGVDDLVIVDTEDTLMITTRSRAQQVKSLVEHLRQTDRDEFL